MITPAPARLVLGPLLRYVGDDEAERLIEERRGSGDASADYPPPGDVADFEEYTWLYRELLVLDSRAGRVLDEDRREMLSEPEWAWVEDCVTGDFDHLLGSPATAPNAFADHRVKDEQVACP